MFDYDELVLISECLDLLKNEYGVEVSCINGKKTTMQGVIDKIDNMVDDIENKRYS